MKPTTRITCVVLSIIFLISQVARAERDMAKRQTRSAVIEVENPEEVLGMLSMLMQSILGAMSVQPEKRNVDFGFSRGYSGSQTAKHLMGLAAANFAGGPGRRRRSTDDQDEFLNHP